MHHPTDETAPVVEHCLEREIAQWVGGSIDPTTHRTMSERSYHGATSRSHEEEGGLIMFKLQYVTHLLNVSWIRRYKKNQNRHFFFF